MKLAPVDYIILATYFAMVLGIGWMLRKKVSTSGDFLLSGRAVPVWITSLAFIAANLGAQELIGMAASGAKYGIMTAHFYWIGAIPAMVFMGLFMMPFYYGSKARSVPEFLKMRFDEKTRGFNAIMFAVMTIFSSGISMYALGLLLHLVLGWNFTASVLATAVIVLAYTYLGGLTSAIYNEVLQFFLIVAGFAPLAILSCAKAGGWHGIVSRLSETPAMTHSWRYLGNASENPMGVEIFGVVAGLGFVLSFGYWCTNFLVVQRAMAADSMSAARRTPLIGAIPKMFLPFVVILPGIAAVALAKMAGPGGAHLYELPMKLGVGGGYGQGLRPGAHHADGQVLPGRHTGRRADRPDGVVHVRHGRQRDRLQYGFHLRYLPELHPQGRARPALPEGGQNDHHRRRGAFDRRRVPGGLLQQHHGHPAVRLRLWSTLLCSPPSCWACSGSAATANGAFYRAGHRNLRRGADLVLYGRRGQGRCVRSAA